VILNELLLKAVPKRQHTPLSLLAQVNFKAAHFSAEPAYELGTLND
jgi:uncharacterized protein YwqG